MAAAAGQGPAAAAAAAPPAAAPLQANDAVQPLSQQQRLAEVLRFCLPVVLVPLVSCWRRWAWTGLGYRVAMLCFLLRGRTSNLHLYPCLQHSHIVQADPIMSLIDTICLGRMASSLELAALGPASLLLTFRCVWRRLLPPTCCHQQACLALCPSGIA